MLSNVLLHMVTLISEETYGLLAAVVLMLKPEPAFGAKSDDILGTSEWSKHRYRGESP